MANQQLIFSKPQIHLTFELGYKGDKLLQKRSPHFKFSILTACPFQKFCCFCYAGHWQYFKIKEYQKALPEETTIKRSSYDNNVENGILPVVGETPRDEDFPSPQSIFFQL